MTKPILLGAIHLDDDVVVSHLIKELQQTDTGSLNYVIPLKGVYDGIGETLKKRAALSGFKPRKSALYGSGSIIPIVGSIGLHNDPGLGNVLCWLLYSDFPSHICQHKGMTSNGSYQRPKPELITSHGSLTVSQGEFFVFNANNGHAWVSNTRCVLAQIPVSKLPSKKQSFKP
jgi:hypothetical protein